MLLIADFWMANWPVQLVGTVSQDIYGNAITVGSFVKMVGQVTAINPTDGHFGEIQVQPVHPGSIGPFVADVQTGQFPQSQFYTAPNPQLTSGPFGFHPKQLIVGV